jgi:PAS domain-containing protein
MAPRNGGLPSLREAYELGVFVMTAAVISLLAARRRQAQLTLEATVTSIGDGVIVTVSDARIKFLNNVAEKLAGWTLKEAAGEHIKPRVRHRQRGDAPARHRPSHQSAA